MKISKLLLPVVAVAALFSGCQDEDFGYEAKDIKYEKDFKAAFGDIDPNQSWNYATRATVTVSTASDSNIKIYAKRNGRYNLVGDYANVMGTQTLGVDVVAGTQELLVVNGTQSQFTTMGGSVAFGTTRAAHSGTTTTEDGIEITVSTDTEKTKEFTRDETMVWNNFLPEIAYPGNSDGLSKMQDDNKCNINKAAGNFMMVSSGSFLVYPLFYITSQTNTIGVYFENEDGTIATVPLYTTKSGDEMQLGVYEWKYYDRDESLPENARGLEETETFKPAVWNEYKGKVWSEEAQDWVEVITYSLNTPAQYRTITWTSTFDFYDQSSSDMVCDFAKLKSTPIKVELPAGTVFGFYVGVGQSAPTYYSQSDRNSDYNYVMVYDEEGRVDASATRTASNAAVAAGTAQKACHLATFQYGGNTYLGLEDWTNQYFNSDMDFNDVMFVIDGAVPTVVEEDPELSSWILACEDLGGKFDNDFNDVVVKVEHVSGRETATITPLAAGGTLASHICFNTGDDVIDLGEIHDLLGNTTKDSEGYYFPLNVDLSEGRGNAGRQTVIPVAADFSLAAAEAGTNMGGFEIRSYYNGEDGEGTGSVVAAPSLGKVPAMFCLPATYTLQEEVDGQQMNNTYEWGWSSELKSLIPWNGQSGTFPEFANWAADHTANTDWYMHPNGTNAMPAKLISSVPVSSGGGDGDGDGDGDDEPSSDIVCTVSDVVEVTLWGTPYHGQTITIPSEGVTAGDKLQIESNGQNKDFGTEYGNSSYAQGNRTELTITEAMIGATIYVTLYDSDSVTKATIKKQE